MNVVNAYRLLHIGLVPESKLRRMVVAEVSATFFISVFLTLQ